MIEPRQQVYNLRKWNHDYYGPFIYHIILKKREGIPDFGRIVGNPSVAPGKPGSARTDYSKLGYAISNALKNFESQYTEFKKWQFSIMPDHIHLILQKNYRTEVHLSDYMEILKGMVAEKYVEERQDYLSPDDIFTEGFTDKLLYRNVGLHDWIQYVANNPHRKAMIMQRPDFFQRVRNLLINGKIYEAYGNLFFLRNPDKFPVRVRRSFTDKEIREYKNLALEKSKEGTVLVSPFISKAEREIRNLAEQAQGKFIRIVHEEFREKFKPAKHDFELCSEGRLLIISLGMKKGTKLSYRISTEMNELAAEICRH